MTTSALVLWIMTTAGTVAAVFFSRRRWQGDIEAHLGMMSAQWIAEQRADQSRHRSY